MWKPTMICVFSPSSLAQRPRRHLSLSTYLKGDGTKNHPKQSLSSCHSGLCWKHVNAHQPMRRLSRHKNYRAHFVLIKRQSEALRPWHSRFLPTVFCVAGLG